MSVKSLLMLLRSFFFFLPKVVLEELETLNYQDKKVLLLSPLPPLTLYWIVHDMGDTVYLQNISIMFMYCHIGIKVS